MNYSITRSAKRSNLASNLKTALSSLFLTALSISATAQYCVPGYTNGCATQGDLNSFTLIGEGVSTITDLNTGCGLGGGYEDRTAIVPAVDLMQGGIYSGTITTGSSNNVFHRIWIDFDNNSTFDPAEAMQSNIGPFGIVNPSVFNLTIPITAATGVHRMRVRLVFTAPGTIQPCQTEGAGETHDYLVNILPAPACNGAPVITSLTPVGPINTCAGATHTLNLSVPVQSGYAIQWQESTTGGASWNNVGTNATSYTFTVAGSIQYRVIVTCTNTSQSTTSSVVQVNATPPAYAALPYFQDFEQWVNYCDVLDVPASTGVNWTNNPSTGNSSWRREDQGATANWSSGSPYAPSAISGSHSARFSSGSATNGVPGHLDLYLDCSQQTGNKAVYFYHINPGVFSIGDSLSVWLSTNAGANFTQIGGVDSASAWTRHSFPIVSNSAQTILRFEGKNPNFDFTDIGLDSVYIALPCTGLPVAGTITPAGPLTGCTGSSFTLGTLGTSVAGNLTYQWQQSLNGSFWTNIPGANSPNLTTPALYDTTYFRLIVTCAGSSQAATTAAIVANVASPSYAALPYSQGFEAWVNRCDFSDVPSLDWVNTPATGDMSWRRDDQGSTANWLLPTFGAYAPVSIEGSHSARIHSSFGNIPSGDLDLFVNCGIAGNKELQYHYINPSGFDTLEVWLSSNGGASFTKLDSTGTSVNWSLRTVTIPSTSPQTIIRFRGTFDFNDDIGLDNIKVLLPCVGAPVAGIVDSIKVCSGQNFTLGTTGTTIASGIIYTWQESTNGTTWVNSAAGANATLTTNITAPTWYRLIVFCANSSISDTTAPRLLQLGSFYLCYCQSAATTTINEDIGNFTVRTYPFNQVILNNGSASPLSNNPSANKVYTDYTNLAPTDLFKNNVYRFFVTQINQQSFFPSAVSIFLDMNRDGIFDPVKERILQKSITTASQQINDTFRIPDTAQIGLTGLRIVLSEGSFSNPGPCLTYNNGETEDYLVNIDYQPCDGASSAGIAITSDTLLCPGYPFTLTDTTYEKHRSGLSFIWQSSPDNQNWTDIAGSNGQSIFPHLSSPVLTYYRLKLDCSFSSSATYSSVVHVSVKPPYHCYCQSFANGGAGDVSDIGAMSVGNFIINGGGPHLDNPVADKAYSTPAGLATTVVLYTDSIYNLSAYHTMRSSTHQDAKVTMFIDYNNNFVYDIPAERVWTGFTSAANVFVSSTLQIPSTAVLDVPTGMRLIINNDTGPNVPSDEACGPYTSGETEDYAVVIKSKASLGTGSVDRLSSFTLFPNPTTGRFTLKLSADLKDQNLKLRITSVTGQQVLYKEFPASGREFITEIDMEAAAAGVYIVELSDNSTRAIRKLMIR